MENEGMLTIACFLGFIETYDFVRNIFLTMNEEASVGYVYLVG